MKKWQWKLITVLLGFIMAMSFSTSTFVYAETPEELQKKKEQQEKKDQQEKLKKQQEQQKQQEQLKKQQEQQKQQEQLKKQQEQQKKQDQLKKQQEQQKPPQRPVGPPPGQTGAVSKPSQPGTPGKHDEGQQGQPEKGKTPGKPGAVSNPPQSSQPGTPRKHDEGKQGQPGKVQTPGQPGTVSTPPQPGTPGRHDEVKQGQPGKGPTLGKPGEKGPQQPGVKQGQGSGQTTANGGRHPATINIKQPPKERQRVLAERRREITPQHNVRAAAHFRDERARFKPAKRATVRYSPEIERRVFERHDFHPETYYARRAVFYETYQFHTPVWAFSLQPRYGLWDTPALAFILVHASDEQYSSWYYHHRFDPDVVVWHQEMNRLAAANAELADQLATMDARANELESRGVIVDNSYVPPEMADVALASEIAAPEPIQGDEASLPPPQPQQYRQTESQRYSSDDEVQRKIDQMQEEIDALKQQQQNQQPETSYP